MGWLFPPGGPFAQKKPTNDTSTTDKSLQDYVQSNGNARGYIQTLLKGANNVTQASIDVKCGDFGWKEAYDKDPSTGIANIDTDIEAGIGPGELLGLLKGCHVKLHTRITKVDDPVKGVNEAKAAAAKASDKAAAP